MLIHLLQIESLGDGRLHLDRLLHLKVNLTFSAVVVDRPLVLHKPAQVLNVSLQQHLEDDNSKSTHSKNSNLCQQMLMVDSSIPL